MNDYNVYRDGSIEKQIGARVSIKRWTVGIPVEKHAEAQLHNVANLPFIDPHGVAALPDIHVGTGCTIGTVIPTIGAVAPSLVGSDIGCGVIAHKTTLKRSMLPRDLKQIRLVIESAIPHGFSFKNDPGSWREIPAEVNIDWTELEPGYKKLIDKHPGCTHKNPVLQLGTLGSGNHCFELCHDEGDEIWFLVHSGSRGPGGKIGSYFTKLAKQDMKSYFIDLPDESLAFFPVKTEHFKNYWDAVLWAQKYAATNRELMVELAFKALKKSKLVPKFELTNEVIKCHHNYVTLENHFKRNIFITRKGAISAKKGEMGVILANMGTASKIVRGLGNKESYYSASHGAGRVMSRTKARNTFNVKEHIEATAEVECIKDSSVIDETPAAYKSIDNVMDAQKDLVEIVGTLKQLVCIKGSSEEDGKFKKHKLSDKNRKE